MTTAILQQFDYLVQCREQLFPFSIDLICLTKWPKNCESKSLTTRIDQGSISSTLYVRIFRTNVVLAAFFLVTCM